VRARNLRPLAWATLAIAATCSVAAIAISSRNGPIVVEPDFGGVSTSFSITAVFSLLLLCFSLVGVTLAVKRPGNGLGWLFCGSGLVLAFSNLASTYETHGISTNPGSLPGAEWFGLASDVLWIPFISTTTVFLFLWFPEGRPVGTGRRRASRIATAAVLTATIVGALAEPHLYQYKRIPNPLGVHLSGWFTNTLVGIGFAVILLTLLYSVASLIGRLRRATGDERLQLRWFVYAAGLVLVFFVPSTILDSVPIVVQVAGGISLLAIPASVAIAVLKYRLYDIDVVISKTIVYGALALFISAVYVAIVVGAGLAIGAGSSNLALQVTATAVVAIGFQPLRSRFQRIANRFVYGERATPYEVLTRFSERMAGTYATEDVLPRTARVIAEGTGAERTDVWLRIGDTLRPGATWPFDGARSDPIALESGALPAIPVADHAAPVTFHDQLLGAISVAMPATQPITPAARKLVDDLASQAGLVLSNVRLAADLEFRLEQIAERAAELRASRQRIVAAQDDERRRLERNIHDGAQQHLVALAVKLRLARGLVRTDPAKARAMLGELESETEEALDTLIDLSRGIYPPLLEEQGIAAALAAQYTRSGLDVHMTTDGARRYAIEVEAAVYFCVLEALQNAAKYAGDGAIEVAIGERSTSLEFSVTDHGRGFDPDVVRAGSGLQNMSDRVSVLGGTVRVESTPGSGTVVRGSVPLVEAVA